MVTVSTEKMPKMPLNSQMLLGFFTICSITEVPKPVVRMTFCSNATETKKDNNSARLGWMLIKNSFILHPPPFCGRRPRCAGGSTAERPP